MIKIFTILSITSLLMKYKALITTKDEYIFISQGSVHRDPFTTN